MDMRSPQWNESQGDTAVTGRTTTENLIHAHTPVRKARHHYHLSFHYTYYLCMRQAFEALNIYIQVAAKNRGFEMHNFFLSVSDFIHNCHFTDKKKKHPPWSSVVVFSGLMVFFSLWSQFGMQRLLSFRWYNYSQENTQFHDDNALIYFTTLLMYKIHWVFWCILFPWDFFYGFFFFQTAAALQQYNTTLTKKHRTTI